MVEIKGLEEYLNKSFFKENFNIPDELNISYTNLAQGEYNINYLIYHPVTNEKLVLRINTGSQMHLENQIQYEYDALKFLEGSGRTPRPLFVDSSKEYLDFGLLVMEFLEGRSLNYKTDLPLAAECLADIHSVDSTNFKKLISPQNPLQAILDECNEMFKTYYNSPLGSKKIKDKIYKLLKRGEENLKNIGNYEGRHCCINTELNSGNFLINGFNKNNYIVDWEKPLLGNPVQDLGHFLAPTTTYWKTDVILLEDEIEEFTKTYMKAVNDRFSIEDLKEQLELFISTNCLRGITWCSMAWVQYNQLDKLIKNEDTYKKIEAYLEENFIKYIENMYFK